MATLLGIVTVLSLALAAGMAVIVWRLLQSESQRSEARVEALRQMADAESGAFPEPGKYAALADDLMMDPEPVTPVNDRMSGPADLFSEPPVQPAWIGRLAIASGIAIVLIGSVTLMRWVSRDVRDLAPQALATGSPAGSTTLAVSLELLSLHHEQKGQTLTITGLVQNPRTGRPLDGVIATAHLLASDGSVLGSGRAALDYTRLAPGDESPFLVTVPVADGVARYRVGFRTSDGRVVGHVDRRPTPVPVAQRQ